MAGYIGSKAVNLSTTGADINGDANIDGDLSFGDNDKAIFGAGSDLQIYHDGSHSYVSDQGTGNIKILADDFILKNSADTETMIQAFTDASVSLWYDGSSKFATTATGIDVTGTVTSDGLTVDGNATIQNTGNSYRTFTIGSNRSASVNTLGRLDFDWDGTPVARIHSISGTDATNKDNGDLVLSTSESGTLKQRLFIDQNGDISFYEDTGTTAKFFWDASAESLGIGTSSPSDVLEITSGSSNFGLLINNASGNPSRVTLTNSEGSGYIDQNNNLMRFNQSGSVDLSIDSSGNLLVGTTDNNPANDTSGTGGIALGAASYISVGRANDPSLFANRIGSDGDITSFFKNGSHVGIIGVNNTDNLFISGNGAHAGLEFLGVSIAPHKNGSLVDNTLDIGTGSNRFDDIYATNATIQTSDRNEKQDIEELSDAEQRVAVATKGLLRKFRWRDAVEAKGDEARTHFGIIAQDLQAAFAAEGLDAGDYAMFISSTWTDEETGEERTRMGVRYSELLAFIIGAL